MGDGGLAPYDVFCHLERVSESGCRLEAEPPDRGPVAADDDHTSEMLQRVTDGALQVHGGIGYFKSPIERVYRDARAQRFEEGTVEVQKQTIVRSLLQ